MKLTKRLSSCLQYTKGFSKLADIGTDHALLPIAAVQEGFVLNALAIDNKIGPFGIALNSVKESNVSNKIKVILGDGLDKIDDQVDVVVISGMGGSLISDILQNHNRRFVKRFILQPNNDAEKIRAVLSAINYYIIDELVISENSKFYDLIILEKGTLEYSPLELLFGPINLKVKSHYFILKIQKELNRLNSLLNGVKDSKRLSEIKKKIALLEEALK